MEEASDGSIRYFVPGLPLTVTDDDLNAYFSGYGKVMKAVVVKERGTESSRGFGYVTMADTQYRDAIVTTSHEIGGLSVRALLTKDHLGTSEVLKVHIDGLPPDLSADAIREAFSQFGIVLDVHRPKDFVTGEKKRFGFVTFSSPDAFNAALSTGRIMVGNLDVSIKTAAQTKGDGKGKGKAMGGMAGGGGCMGGACGGCMGCGNMGGNSMGGMGGCGMDGQGWGQSADMSMGPGVGGGWDGWDGSMAGGMGGMCGKGGYTGGPGPCMGGCCKGAGATSSGDAGVQNKKKEATKYFLPGLHLAVKDDDLRAHFSKYGEVVDCAVVVDKASQVSRGFGYVTMADDSLRDTILNDKHEIGGHQTPVLLTKDSLGGASVCKVHIGKLREDIPPESIRVAMSNFGTVLDVHTPKDARSGNRYNYAFVTFSSMESYDACMQAGTTTIEDCQVTLKPAIQSKEPDMGSAMWGGKGSSGGMMGGWEQPWGAAPGYMGGAAVGWSGGKGKDMWGSGMTPGGNGCKGYDSWCSCQGKSSWDSSGQWGPSSGWNDGSAWPAGACKNGGKGQEYMAGDGGWKGGAGSCGKSWDSYGPGLGGAAGFNNTGYGASRQPWAGNYVGPY
mmetsp:Transcript_44709/g.103365  ORF Transcript_44709/g.103365 Transcript_44709/m.103365 type:complete len:614 (+) Transcript_44709:57-1898(+)